MPHTKLPWGAGKHLIQPASKSMHGIYGPNGEFIGAVNIWEDDPAQARENEEFILRACNCHSALVESLEETLRALEAHLDESCRDHNIKHRDLLCSCNTHEVVRVKSIIAKVKGGR